MGEVLLSRISRCFRFHDLDVFDEASIKVAVVCNGDGSFEFIPGGEKIPGRKIQVENEKVESSYENPGDSDNLTRVEISRKFGGYYQQLEKALSCEWERVSNLDTGDYQIKEKKVFICADPGVTSVSGVILPLVGALKYLLRKEDIPHIHWNLFCFTGIESSPEAKINTYAFLRELSALKQENCSFKATLKTPPIDREVELSQIDLKLFLLDARSRGVAALKKEQLADVAARYMLLESFYEPQNVNPSDQEVYFHSPGTSELDFPLKEILRAAAGYESMELAKIYQNQDEMNPEKTADFTKKALKTAESNKLQKGTPDFSLFLWKEVEPDFDKYRQNPDIKERIQQFYDAHKKRQVSQLRDHLGKSAREHPYFREIKENLIHIMESFFYSFEPARKFLNQQKEKMDNLIQKLQKVDTNTPSDEVLEQKIRQMKLATAQNAKFPMIIASFLFILSPFAIAAYDFLLWKYPGGEYNIYKILISAIVILASVGGAHVQKLLMEDSLKETFLNLSETVQRKNRGEYHQMLKKAFGKFYGDLRAAIGIERDEESSWDPDEDFPLDGSLSDQVELYISRIKQAKLSVEVETEDFYGVQRLFDPKSTVEVEKFSRKFLNREVQPGDTDFYARCPAIFEKIKDNLPGFEEVLQCQEKASEFLHGFNREIFKGVKQKASENGIDLKKILGETGKDEIVSLTGNLLKEAAPLVKISDVRLKDEFQTSSDEKILFIPGEAVDKKRLQDLFPDKQVQFSSIPVEGEFLISLKTLRYKQLYKLSDLEDYRYFMDKLEQEKKEQIYCLAGIEKYPHINYESRAGGENNSCF